MRRWHWLLVLFLVTSILRFLDLRNGFPNDHFLHLASAQQMSYGDWPTRDFVDPGQPLMIVASAVAQVILGHTLFAEAVFVSIAFAAAAALTCSAVVQYTGSLFLGVLAAILEVAVFPRTYGYPKMLVYALGFWCCARYLAKPSRARMVALAIAVAGGFLFRHDHLIFLGAGALLTVILADDVKTWRTASTHALILGAMIGALVLPYLVYVQLHGGLGQYLAADLEYSLRESGRQGHQWPNPFSGTRVLADLFQYELYLMPVIALIVVAVSRKTADFRRMASEALPLAVVALLTTFAFVRVPLAARMPDAITPAVVLGAWLAHRAWTSTRAQVLGAWVSILAVALFSASVNAVGQPLEEINRAGLLGKVRDIPDRFRERTAALTTPLEPSQMTSRTAAYLAPFLEYVDRCTPTDFRLLTAGFIPEVSYLARRPYAGGQSTFGPWWVSEDMQRLALQRLQNQRVPFVIIPSEYAGAFEQFTLIAGYVHARYRPLTTISTGGDEDEHVDILIDTTMPAPGRDEATGWPCYRR